MQSRWNRAARIVPALLMAIPATALGQAAPAAAKEFRASVLDLSKSTQRITVPLNRSVTVETTVEIARADVIARQIADVQVVSPTRLLINGQGYGTTTVVLAGGDNKPYVFEVSVELDLERLKESLQAIDPQAKVNVSSVQGNIVLTGTVSSTTRAERMTELAQIFLPVTAAGTSTTAVQNHLEVAGEQQVLLRCVVAEVNRRAVRELGVNGFLAGDDFQDAFLVNQLGGINPANIGAAADALVTERIPFLTGEDGIPLTETPTLSLGFPRVQMQLFIKAMADNTLLQVLAEPNLVARSGETARFLAGGEFPVPVPQGNQQVTIEYREYGVRLNFTPVVDGHQRIRLRIAPEISELDFSVAVQVGGFPVPGLTARSAETTVEIGSGQTLAIAGLLSESVRGVTSRIPGFGDLPVLGTLFRSVNYQRNLSELVILVTPEIVAPLDAHQVVKLPGQGHKDPNDYELYVLGLIDGRPPKDESKESDDSAGTNRYAPTTLASQPEEISIHGPWGHAGRSTGVR
jgi:pilus assembly protein CpaC